MRALVLAALVGLAAAPAGAVEIALTFDDLPAHSALPPGVTRTQVAADTLAAFKAAGTPPVYGFVNGVQLEKEPGSGEVLKMWRAAGHPLGNHTWSHMDLEANTAEAFEADTVRNEPLLAEAMGNVDWRWFRYPYLNEGDTAEKRARTRRMLATRGYRVASVTMSFNDYAWNEPYARCAAKGDAAAIAALERRYLEAAQASLAYSRAMSQALLGRDIPYVLLMHIGAFDARMLPRLLALYRADGVTFVSLEQAERDPFYRDDVAAAASPAPATLEDGLKARGLPLPAKAWTIDDLAAVCR